MILLTWHHLLREELGFATNAFVPKELEQSDSQILMVNDETRLVIIYSEKHRRGPCVCLDHPIEIDGWMDGWMNEWTDE